MDQSAFDTSINFQKRLQIFHSVNGSLQDITVDDICASAGISRHTFYKYFNSKYDIFQWHCSYCSQFYLDEIGRTIDCKTGFFHHYRLLAQESHIYKVGLKYTLNIPYGMSSMPAYRMRTIISTLKIIKILMLVMNFYLLLMLIQKWKQP